MQHVNHYSTYRFIHPSLFFLRNRNNIHNIKIKLAKNELGKTRVGFFVLSFIIGSIFLCCMSQENHSINDDLLRREGARGFRL